MYIGIGVYHSWSDVRVQFTNEMNTLANVSIMVMKHIDFKL